MQKQKKVININRYRNNNKRAPSLKSSESSRHINELRIKQQTKDKSNEHIIIQLRKQIEHINNLMKDLKPTASSCSQMSE